MLTINKLYIKTHKNRTQILSRFSCEIMLTSHAKRFSIEIFSSAMLPRWRTIIVTIRLLKPKIPSSAPLSLSLSLSLYTYISHHSHLHLSRSFTIATSGGSLLCRELFLYVWSLLWKKIFWLSNNEVTRRQNSHES